MSGVIRDKRNSKQMNVATTISTLSQKEQEAATLKLANGIREFKKEQKVQDALNLSKQIGNFIYERKNGVPDKIAENKANSLITNILTGIAEGKPSREIVTDLRRLAGCH